MKRFTKTLLSVAAVSAVSAAMTVSAMAMSATYDAEAGTLTFTEVNTTGTSQTLLVLNNDATTVAEADIVQIDQKDDSTAFATTKVGTLADGTYYVRIGGTDGTMQKYTLTVSSTSVETEEIVIGDTSGDGLITNADAGHVLRASAELTTRIGNAGKKRTAADGVDSVVIGDTSGDGLITNADAGHVLRASAELTTRIGNAGKKVSVIVE